MGQALLWKRNRSRSIAI